MSCWETRVCRSVTLKRSKFQRLPVSRQKTVSCRNLLPDLLKTVMGMPKKLRPNE
ncbi:MAG: hypothetical protein IJF17_13675 [Thermoguttaceae bacterium]|nr:hypothetical protein [Thermoguttaceae bacterium]